MVLTLNGNRGGSLYENTILMRSYDNIIVREILYDQTNLSVSIDNLNNCDKVHEKTRGEC